MDELRIYTEEEQEQDLLSTIRKNNLDEILQSKEAIINFKNMIIIHFKIARKDIDELFTNLEGKFNSQHYRELDYLLEDLKIQNKAKLPRYKFYFKPEGKVTLSMSKNALSLNQVKFKEPIELVVLDIRDNGNILSKQLGKSSYVCIAEDNQFIKVLFNSIDIEKIEKTVTYGKEDI